MFNARRAKVLAKSHDYPLRRFWSVGPVQGVQGGALGETRERGIVLAKLIVPQWFALPAVGSITLDAMVVLRLPDP